MKKFILVALYIFIININTTSAQWVQTNGPFGGTIQCSTVSNSTIYVGTTWAVYKSIDNGISWSCDTVGFGGNRNIISIAASGTTVFALFSGGGVLVSFNSANNWILHDIGLPANINTGALKIFGSNVYLCLDLSQTYTCTTAGSNWALASTFPFGTEYYAVDDNILFAKSGGIKKSIDNGLTWTQVTWPFLAGLKYFATQDSNYLVYKKLNSKGNLYFSNDQGVSWTSDSIGLPFNYSIWSYTINGSAILIGLTGYGDSSGVYISNDKGLTWNPTSLMSEAIFTLAQVGSNVVAGAQYYGTFTTFNNGLNWVSTGVAYLQGTAISSGGTKVFCNAGSGIDEFFVTNNKGDSWEKVKDTGMPKGAINAFGAMAFDSVVFWGSTNLNISHVYISHDYGINWQIDSSGFPPGLHFYSYGILNSTYFIGTNQGVYQSTDFGKSWIGYSIGFGTNMSIISLLTIDSIVFAGTSNGLYKSLDNGITWNIDTIGMGMQSTTAILNIDSNIYVGCYGNDGVFVRSINGLVWNSLSSGLTDIISMGSKDSLLFVSTQSNGIFMSTDYGFTWVSINDNLPGFSSRKIIILGSDLFLTIAGIPNPNLNSGVWKRSISSIVNATKESDFQNNLLLSPNPANNKLNIKINHVKGGKVEYKIFDTLGYEHIQVCDFVNNNCISKDIDISRLNAGVYIIRVSINNEVYTNKFIKE